MPSPIPMTPQRINPFRNAPMIIGIVALLAGLWTSLTRLGFDVGAGHAIHHGPLMVGGFIGTVIALERAVALGRPWGYAAPWFGAIGGLSFLVPLPAFWAYGALFLSSLALVMLFVVFLWKQWSDFTFIMGVGALCWAVGNGILLGGVPLPYVVPWWAAFLILTIAGERIEMSRLIPRPPWAQHVVIGLAIAYFVSLLIHTVAGDLGVRISGVILILLSLWFARFDIARRTIRSRGLPQYAAFCILTGYIWLIFSGIMSVIWGPLFAGLHYDAWIHAQFVGFVLVMIMAHAPIIFPAVTGMNLPFNRWFYAPVILLHTSLAARIGADLLLSARGRQWAGLGNIISVLAFLVVVIGSNMYQRFVAAKEQATPY